MPVIRRCDGGQYVYLPLSRHYIRQVNRVKLADILFSLVSVCLSVCLCALSPVFNSVCPSHSASAISLMRPMSIPKPLGEYMHSLCAF